MIIEIPLFGIGLPTEERMLQFIDISKTEYNVIYFIKDKETKKVKEAILVGHINKRDLKRLAKAS